jgi:hypothetical protein
MFKPTRFGDFSSEYTKIPLPSLGLVWAKTDGKSVEVLGWGDQPHIELKDLPEKTRKKLLKLNDTSPVPD